MIGKFPELFFQSLEKLQGTVDAGENALAARISSMGNRLGPAAVPDTATRTG
jgi:hypothetical protein